MELFVDDLDECHGDVRGRAMMMRFSEYCFGKASCCCIYCDPLSVSQYDSKVRSLSKFLTKLSQRRTIFLTLNNFVVEKATSYRR